MRRLIIVTGLLLLIYDLAAQREVQDVYNLFSKAYQNYDSGILKTIYADEAIYLSPGLAIEIGSHTFIAGFKGMFEGARERNEALNISFKIVRRRKEGKVVIDIGYYKLVRSSLGEEDKISVGKFIAILEKFEDGNWKFIADGYSEAPIEAFPN